MHNQTFRWCRLITKKIPPKVFQPSLVRIVPNVNIFLSKCPTANYVTVSQRLSTKKGALIPSDVKELLLKQTITQEDLESITSKPEYNKVFQLRMQEVDMMKHEGGVPRNLKPVDWIKLIITDTKLSRRKYLRYRCMIEVQEETDKERRELKQITKPVLKYGQKPVSDLTQYNLHNNSLFLRISYTHINHFYNKRLLTLMPHLSNLVFDCGYEDYMGLHEISNCAKQMMITFSQNRIHEKPFVMHFCNLKEQGQLRKHLLNIMPTFLDPGYPIYSTSKCYSEIFRTEDLIYLSPHATQPLTEFDPDKVYIIGAYVDKYDSKKLSVRRAMENHICARRFPLEYLDWGPGSTKNLTINQTGQILLDLQTKNNWKLALKHIPQRKLQDSRLRQLVQKVIQNTNKKTR